jgi:hypothetical protein
VEFWISSSGRAFIKRGVDSKAARASSSVGLGLGTGPVIDLFLNLRSSFPRHAQPHKESKSQWTVQVQGEILAAIFHE